MAKYYFRLFLLIGVLIGIVALIGSLLPRSYEFQSSATIDASADEIFPALNSLKRWPEWSRQWNPDEIDSLTIQYNGVEAGVGAAQTWTDRRGSGKLWITKSIPEQEIEFDMEFEGFPRMRSNLTLSESSEDGPTTVTWRSRGKLPAGPFYGYFGTFFSTQMKHEYEKSLERLKSNFEK